MGYTHKWYRPLLLPSVRWKEFRNDWVRVYDEIVLRGLALLGPGNAGSPVMNTQLVAFNGGCEDFLLARRFEMPDRMRDGRGFSFCKTQRLPYDLGVTGCLLVAKRHLENLLEVYSDGEDADWQPARDLCASVLGYGQTFRIADRYQLIDCRS